MFLLLDLLGSSILLRNRGWSGLLTLGGGRARSNVCAGGRNRSIRRRGCGRSGGRGWSGLRLSRCLGVVNRLCPGEARQT